MVAGILATSPSSIETQPNTYLHKLYAAVQGVFLTKEQKEVFVLRQEHVGKLRKQRHRAISHAGQCSLGKRHGGTYWRAGGLGFFGTESSDYSSGPLTAVFNPLMLSNSIALLVSRKHGGYLPPTSL